MAERELWHSLARFGAWTLLAAAPFYLAGGLFGRISWFPSVLPWSALALVVPATVAVVLGRREGRTADLARQLRLVPRHLGWWVVAAAVGAGPTLVDAARHGPWTPPAAVSLAALFAVYLVAALGEELGWTGFAMPRLLAATGSVWLTGLALGTFWMIWHAIPFIQTGHGAPWVAFQSLQIVLGRCIIVGVCAASGGRVWLAVLIHALSDLAWSAAPSGGALYDPAFVDLLLLPLSVAALIAGARRARAWRDVGGGRQQRSVPGVGSAGPR